jgi:hypothetical protein
MSYLPTTAAAVQEPNGFATLSSNQTISSGSWQTVSLATLESTSYDVTFNATDKSLVVNTAGFYNVYGSTQLEQSGSGGERSLRIRVDTGSGFTVEDNDNEREADAGTYQYIRLSTGQKWFDVGDEIDLQIYQDDGGDLTLYANDNNTNLKIIRVSI